MVGGVNYKKVLFIPSTAIINLCVSLMANIYLEVVSDFAIFFY